MPAYTSSVALDDLSKLPKVAIVHMEHAPETFWRASGDVEPGTPVVPTGEAHGKTFYEVGGKVIEISGSASVAANSGMVGIAMNETGILTAADLASETTGPNEVVNATIASGSWVRVMKQGTIFTPLLEPVADFDATYPAGTLVGYDPAADRAATIDGTGAFVAVSDRADALGYVVESKMVVDEGSVEAGYASVTLFGRS